MSCAIVAYFFAGELPERAVHQVGPGLGIDWMVLDLLKSTVIFIFLEKLFPKYKEQAILRPEWQLDLGYFTMNHILIGALLFVANGFAPSVFGWAEHIDWLAGSRTHLVQTIIDRALVVVPLYLLGPTTEALNTYVIIVAFQAVFIHSNFGIPLGPIGYLLVTPKFHHWHHSKDKPAIDTDYAAHLPILDLMFGTFHMPKEYWPKEYGTLTRLPRTFMAQFMYPFRSAKRPKDE